MMDPTVASMKAVQNMTTIANENVPKAAALPEKATAANMPNKKRVINAKNIVTVMTVTAAVMTVTAEKIATAKANTRNEKRITKGEKRKRKVGSKKIRMITTKLEGVSLRERN